MNMDWRSVVWLRDNGHDVTHLRDQGLQRMAYVNIFAKAQVEGRIVITFDLDFGDIAAATAGKGASVILFRLKNKRTSFVIRRLASTLDSCSLALENGAVVVVEDSRHRIRHLPIGKTERNV
jgi:predicted nuclease of predicted toxin-antitoxin system